MQRNFTPAILDFLAVSFRGALFLPELLFWPLTGWKGSMTSMSPKRSQCIGLHWIGLHCIALHCIALHCIALHWMLWLLYPCPTVCIFLGYLPKVYQYWISQTLSMTLRIRTKSQFFACNEQKQLETCFPMDKDFLWLLLFINSFIQ